MTGGGLDARDARRRLYGLDPSEFEEVVAKLWRANGWDASTTPSGADRGVDVVATRGVQKVLIQAKRYGPENPVSGPEVQQYGSLFLQERGVDAVFVVTTSRFTEQARRRAQEVGVTLVNGDELARLVADATQPSERIDEDDSPTDVDDGDGRPLDADEMTVGAAAGTSPHETVGEAAGPAPSPAEVAGLAVGGLVVAAAIVAAVDVITAAALGLFLFVVAPYPESAHTRWTLVWIGVATVVGAGWTMP